MSLASSAARGGAVTLGAQGIRFLVTFGGTIILARLLTPLDFGLIAEVVAIVAIAEVFRDFGLGVAALSTPNLTTGQRSNLFWLNAALGIIMAVAVLLIAVPISAFYHEPRLIPVVQLMSVVYLTSALSVQFRISINRQLRFTTLALVDLIPYALSYAVAAVLAILGLGYWALVWQNVSFAVFGMIATASTAGWFPRLPRKEPGMGKLLRFGSNVAGTQLLTYVTRNSDSISIGRVWGAQLLGYYDRAYQFLLLPLNQINTPLSRVAIPVLSRLADDPARYMAYLRRAQLIASYFTASIFLLMAGLAPSIVAILFGPKWTAVGPLLSILAIGGVFRSIVQICYWVYISKGLAGAQFRFYLIGQPAIVIAMLCGLPWGPTGVAIAHSIAFSVYWFVSMIWMGRKADIKVAPLIRDVARIVLLFGAPAGALSWLASHIPAPVILQLIYGLGAGLAWYVVAWLVIPKTRSDIAILVDFGKVAIGRRRPPKPDVAAEE